MLEMATRTANSAIDPSTSLAKLKRLSIAMLKLYLNQHNLAEDSNKTTIAKRLYDHLQTQITSSSSSASWEKGKLLFLQYNKGELTQSTQKDVRYSIGL